MIAATHSLSYVIEASLLFIPLILWIILVAYVFRDLFRNAEMSGVKKAWWVLAQFVLPLVGCLLYFLIHGGSMDQGATQLAAAARMRSPTSTASALLIDNICNTVTHG